MQEYELVQEIQNLCPNNQMRDIFFEEIETEDPAAFVRSRFPGKTVTLTVDPGAGGVVTIYADVGGLKHKFVFTPI